MGKKLDKKSNIMICVGVIIYFVAIIYDFISSKYCYSNDYSFYLTILGALVIVAGIFLTLRSKNTIWYKTILFTCAFVLIMLISSLVFSYIILKNTGGLFHCGGMV